MQYRLITASPTDVSWLNDLRRSVYQDLFQATWGGWDEARHQRHFSECIQRGPISVIILDGHRVGMVQIFDEPAAVDIGEIQVLPRYQNQGIGTQVLRDIIAKAHENRKAVRLAVGLKNDRAYRLYERLGFRLVKQSDTHRHMEWAV